MHLIYYGEDGSAAKARAAELRKRKAVAVARYARVFAGETEPCDHVELMPDVSDNDARRLREAYGNKVKADKKPEPEDDLPTIRAEYHRVVGKRPFNGWNAATLRAKIAEAGNGA